MEINMGNRQLIKNIIMNIVSFAIQFAMSFYIAPVIVGKVGASAYGFVGLANDFITYATVVTTVFNSVAARFISNEFYKKNYEKANNYFNSLIAANTVMSAIFCLLGSIMVINLRYFLNIPDNLLTDVQITFSLVFGGYCLSLLTNVFTTSTFVTNRTDIQGVRNCIVGILKFSLTVTLLSFVSIKIYWISFAGVITTIFAAIWNISLTRKLTPEINIKFKYAKGCYVAELAKSGCWMAFTSMSVILMRGFDLLISNKLLGSNEMGLISLSRAMPNNVTGIINTIAPIFTPMFISFYAAEKWDMLVLKVKESINIMAIIIFVPIVGFIVFSREFYILWQRSLTDESIKTLVLLSNITVVQAFFNASTATMAQLSVVTNKLKVPVFVSFGTGVLNIIIEYSLIRFARLGIYAIVIPETVIMLLRYILFNSFYAAYVLKQPLRTFVGTTVKTWLTIPFITVSMLLVRKLITVNSWGTFIISVGICGVIGYVEMLLLYYRKEILNLIQSRKKS